MLHLLNLVSMICICNKSYPSICYLIKLLKYTMIKYINTIQISNINPINSILHKTRLRERVDEAIHFGNQVDILLI
jgi:hypothetical protein